MQLARNETSDCSNPKIDIFFKKGTTAIDVEVLEFQIFDVSTPAKQLSPVQVFPPSGRATVDVSNDCPTGNRIAAGHFVAEWTVPAAEPLGSHEVRWFFKETALSPEETFSEEFEVTSVIVSSTDDLYITLQDIRDLGIDASLINDTDLELLIRTCQAVLDRMCRQWFSEKTLQFKFDGNDSDTINFGVPVISIEWLRLNNDPNNLSTNLYRVYNERTYPDHRRNPRVSLIRSEEVRDIFTAPIDVGELKFRKGRQNQEIRGIFGFTEADGTPPAAIQEALKRLVVEKFTNPIYVAPGSSPPPPAPSGGAGAIVEEWTDGHKVKFAVSEPEPRKSGLSGITKDPFVLDTVRLYRAPIGIATPADWSFR